MRVVPRTGRKPRSWYTKSLDTWHRIEHPSHSAPNGFEAGDPVIVAKNLQLCDATLSNATLISSDRPEFLVPVV